MGPAVSYPLLVCACAGVVAEVIAVVVPDKVLSILDRTASEDLKPGPFLYLLGILSGFYLVAVVMLFVSGDRVFRIYGFVLLILSAAVWLLKRWVRRVRLLLLLDSIVCLIILIDVIRTVLRCVS